MLDLNDHSSDACDHGPESAPPSLVYHLYGIVVHKGLTTDVGHYFSYVRAADGIWYLMDDDKVTPVSSNVGKIYIASLFPFIVVFNGNLIEFMRFIFYFSIICMKLISILLI